MNACEKRVERVRLKCTACGFTWEPHRYPTPLFEGIDRGDWPATIELGCSNCNANLDAYGDDNEPTIATTHFVDRAQEGGSDA